MFILYNHASIYSYVLTLPPAQIYSDLHLSRTDVQNFYSFCMAATFDFQIKFKRMLHQVLVFNQLLLLLLKIILPEASD